MRKSVGIALIDQAVLSLFNLGLNLAMIRFALPTEFGRFIFAAAVVLVLTSLQNALVSTPLSVLIPGRPPAEQKATASAIKSADLAFRLVAAIAAPLLCLLTSHSPDFLIATALATFTTLGRETARSLVLAHERTIECLRIDLVAIAATVAAVAALWSVFPPAVASLGGIAIGNAIAVATQSAAVSAPRMPMPAALRTYRSKFWPDTQWSLIGAGTTELQYRSYVFALELFRDAAQLAAVQAGRLLLGPLPLVVGAWGRVARPAMARHLAAGNSAGMIRLTTQGLIYVLTVAAIYCAALYAIWPFAAEKVFQGRYPEVGLMTLAWGGYMIVVIAHMVLSVPLQAAMRLKELAQVTMATAVLTCLLLVGLATHVPSIYSVLALAAAEVVALAWIYVLVVRLARAPDIVTAQPVVPAA
ncbi:MAG: hypothetical protein ABL904_03590 [Hyphomicrobiaceae bacterium]